MTDTSPNVGAEIRLGRVVRRLSQRELANAIGSTLQRIWRIENHVRQPRADELRRIAAALDLDPVTRSLIRELATATAERPERASR
jgi:transcriptional regulator with XRE-family HTH domain